eukprot:Awhi_evm1s14025
MQPLEVGADSATIETLLSGESGYAKVAFECTSPGQVYFSIEGRASPTNQNINSLFLFVGDNVTDFNTEHIVRMDVSYPISDWGFQTFDVTTGINHLFITSREKGTQFGRINIEGCHFKGAETCNDGILNQDEVEVDCGGICDIC